MEIGRKSGNSDHQEMQFKIKWDIEIPPNQVQVPECRRVNYEGIRKYLDQVCQVRRWEGVAQAGKERSDQQRGVNNGSQ